jgi:hypothetical protein
MYVIYDGQKYHVATDYAPSPGLPSNYSVWLIPGTHEEDPCHT